MRKPYFKQRISLLLQDMLVLLLRLYKPYNENGTDSKNRKHAHIVDKVLLYLGSHYTESVRLNDIAAFTGYTQGYIDTVFKQSTGYNHILSSENHSSVIQKGSNIKQQIHYGNSPKL